ncbi:MAG: NAD(P)H-hydrate dehydratase [Thermoplasmatota archaeon]
MPLSLRDSEVLDRNSEALGVGVEILMENAGRLIADRIAEELSPRARVVVLAGRGNNGGDGLVAARFLSERFPVTVVTSASGDDFKTQPARRAWQRLPSRIKVVHARETSAIDAALAVDGGVIVDALLGAGLAGELREPYASYVRAVNASGMRVFSVDVPTGFGTTLAVKPDVTFALHDVKHGQTPANSGRIVVLDIGIPHRASTHVGPGEFFLYPKPSNDQHKGQGGTVLVIGGGPYAGAPAVSGLAALRTGADLAIVLTPERAASIISAYSPNLIVRPLNGDDLDFEDPANRVALNLWLKKATSVVVGPGLGLAESAIAGAQHVVERAAKEGKPCVVDADALTALGKRRDLLGASTVVTPHAREFQTLTGETLPSDIEKRAEVARLAAASSRATYLVKGPVDVVTDGERVKLVDGGHPAMSHGGTGDALTGMVAALLAKGIAPYDAARLGAYISKKAGETAANEMSYGLLATDIVDAIPRVLRVHLR